MCKKIFGLPTVKLYEKGYSTQSSIDNATTNLQDETLVFPILTRKSSKEEIREHHLDKIYRLSIKLIGQIPHLDKPSDEQKEWVLFRLLHPDSFPKIRDNKIGDYKNWR
jgi:hypothetical protein